MKSHAAFFFCVDYRQTKIETRKSKIARRDEKARRVFLVRRAFSGEMAKGRSRTGAAALRNLRVKLRRYKGNSADRAAANRGRRRLSRPGLRGASGGDSNRGTAAPRGRKW